MNLQPYIEPPFRILCQSSKKKLLPANYIAIVGDSYAEGGGDWLTGLDHWRNPPFHSAHLINKSTGRDVISFADNGSGSLDSVIAIDYTIKGIRKRFALDDPKIILMYFYEGNDIGDNILALMFDENRFKIKNLKNENLTKKKFEYCLETEIRKDVAVVTPYLVSAKFYLGLLYNAIDKISYKVNHIYSKPSYQEPKIVLINTAVIDKQIIHLPELQGPALEFQKEEIDDAIQVFEYSIESLHEKFPNSKIVTVYIPSVLSCYSFKGNVFIETSCPNCKFHDFSYPQDMVLKRSDEIVRRIQNVCKEQNIKFLDSRSYMRQAALRGPIHGPNDWGHFNKYGYTKFSEYITLFLQKEEL